MPARVLDVGNCDPDHAAIRGLITTHFEAEVERVMFVEEAERALRAGDYALVLVNRLIFADQSPGMALIARMGEDEKLGAVPVMLVSNFAEAQEAAVAAGAKRGFGKAELKDPGTIEKLAAHLPRVEAGLRR